MANRGYLPIRLVMGVSVYSLGLSGGIMAGFRSLLGGQVEGLTEVLYEAREKALARVERDAEACGADEVVGVKTRVYNLGGGLVEFMVIGTAVKKMPGAATLTKALPPQAIIRDRETFVDDTQGGNVNLKDSKAASASSTQRGPISAIMAVVAVIFYLIMIITKIWLQSSH
jgi:uncharacterized protein YbjQ (UPF0145 family)